MLMHALRIRFVEEAPYDLWIRLSSIALHNPQQASTHCSSTDARRRQPEFVAHPLPSRGYGLGYPKTSCYQTNDWWVGRTNRLIFHLTQNEECETRVKGPPRCESFTLPHGVTNQDVSLVVYRHQLTNGPAPFTSGSRWRGQPSIPLQIDIRSFVCLGLRPGIVRRNRKCYDGKA